jgi:hypothetical protein
MTALRGLVEQLSGNRTMNSRTAVTAMALVAASISTMIFTNAHAQSSEGVIRVKSAHDVRETIMILERDIAAKGIKFFSETTRPNSLRMPEFNCARRSY